MFIFFTVRSHDKSIQTGVLYQRPVHYVPLTRCRLSLNVAERGFVFALSITNLVFL
jgi:hypothetical protein